MYILEGNIGAGKSTFLRLIQKNAPYISVGFEPLQDWHSDVNGDSLLTNFYKDPKRWAYTMETFALQVRVKAHLQDQMTQGVHVVERSIYSGRYCFALNSFQNGFMNSLEWNMYLQWFDFLVNRSCSAPLGFIYLKVSPEVAYNRIEKRSRSGEGLIPLEYLEQLHSCHEDLLIDQSGIVENLKNVPVLVLDVNKDFESDHDYFMILLSRINEFIQKTQSTRFDGLTHEANTPKHI